MHFGKMVWGLLLGCIFAMNRQGDAAESKLT